MWHLWRYVHRQARFFTYRWRLYRAAARYLPLFHGRVLDVGAGHQPFRAFLPADTDYLALDVVPMTGNQVVASALALPFREATFEGVLCTEVLEHVPEPAQALAEIYRVLKPGGRAYITVPMTWGLHYEPHDYYRFTRYGIAYLARRVGLEVQEIGQIGGLFTTFLARLEDVVGALVFKVLFPVRVLWGPRWRVVLASWLLLPVVVLLDGVASVLDRVVPWARQDALCWVLLAVRPVEEAPTHGRAHPRSPDG